MPKILNFIYNTTNYFGKVNVILNLIISLFVIISLLYIGAHLIKYGINKDRIIVDGVMKKHFYDKDEQNQDRINFIVEYEYNNKIYQSLIELPINENMATYFNKLNLENKPVKLEFNKHYPCNVMVHLNVKLASFAIIMIILCIILFGYILYRIIYKSKFISSVYGVSNLISLII